MTLSIFDLFKIGIGPSSSHTVGPMWAAHRFLLELESQGMLERVARVEVQLYGSLALTGRGHGTDKAIILGLLGEVPDRIDPDAVDGLVAAVRERKALRLFGRREVAFDEARDLVFRIGKTMAK
ncbi:MAG: serine dehydratase beta chain, partial [Geminicoccaceae bacterium]